MDDLILNEGSHAFDYIIVGGGPGGLQAAYFLQQAGHDYVVLEAHAVGNFFAHLPRHRKLISNNKVNTGCADGDKNLRWDWNSLLSADLAHVFTSYTSDYFPAADVLVDYLQDFRSHFDLNVREGARVTAVGGEPDGTFHVDVQDGPRLRARRVIIATGHTVPHSPEVPGVELCEQYGEVSTDPAEYTNERIMIVGKGNSGLETAENLFSTAATIHLLSPNPVRLAWNTHHVSDVRAVYNNILDSYQLKMQNTVLDADLVSIEAEPDGRRKVTFRYKHAQGQEWTLVVDRVILCCGYRFDFGIFDASSAPERTANGRWPAMTSSWESVSVPGLYFAGTLMQSRDYKRSFSGFIHGFRYGVRFLVENLDERYHGRPRPTEYVGRSAEELTAKLIDRCNNASSIFQLPGFLADVYLLDGPKSEITLHRDTPADFALDHEPWSEAARLIVTLEYGKLPAGADPFDFPRDPLDGTTSQFIHPVLRLYVGDRHVSTHHVPEDLENEWDKPMYMEPCAAAVSRMLASVDTAVAV